ncbi:MAG: tetratricopeptide repeat protein [Gemmatimonadota bacterium]
MILLQLLGGATLRGPDGPLSGPVSHRHRLALLALLTTSYPRPISRDKLMALLWPESDDAHARSLLNLAAHVIRRALGEQALTSGGDGLGLNLDLVSADVIEFEAALARKDSDAAMELYRGPLLDGFFLPDAPEFDRWIERERERLGRLFSGVLEGVAEARSLAGDHQAAVDAWLRLAWAEPFNSRVALRLIQALDAAGDRAGALHHARQHSQFLSQEFGAQPDAELIAFTDQLRRQPTRNVSFAAPRVLEATEARLGHRDHPRISRPNTNPESYNLYLKGRYAWNRRTRESLSQSIRFLRQAVSISPGHAQSWAALADAYGISGYYDYLPPVEAFPPARDAALRAMELDPSLVQPQAMLAYISLYYDWDFAAAERGFLAAIERDGSYPAAQQWYGNVLTVMGRFDEALTAMFRAIELDPLSIIATSAIGWVHYHAGDFPRSIEASKETLRLDEAFVMAHQGLGLALAQIGEPKAALEALERAVTLSLNEPAILAALVFVRARAGDPAEAERLLNQLLAADGYLPSYEIAKAHLALGKTDQAFHWLERARDERSHSMALIGVDPQLQELRAHPRFRDLVASLVPGPALPAPPVAARPPVVTSLASLDSSKPTAANPPRVRFLMLAGLILVLAGISGVTLLRGRDKGRVDRGGVPQSTAVDSESNILYQKGRYAWNRRTREGLEQAVTYFTGAIKRSPDYALAHAGLADTYAVLGFYDYLKPADAFESARQSARAALRLDPRLAAPHATLGYVNLYYDWDLAAGEKEFREAIRIDPEYSVAHQWYGNLLSALGRFDEAATEMQRAQSIDPQSIIASAALGWVYYYGGQQDSAIGQLFQTLELDQNFSLAHQWLGFIYLEQGRWSDAVSNLQRALSLSPTSAQADAALAYGLARAGDADSARSVLDGLLKRAGYLPSFDIAKVYLALGDTGSVFTWLERARLERSHSMVFLKVDPQLKSLKSNARFQNLVHAAGM